MPLRWRPRGRVKSGSEELERMLADAQRIFFEHGEIVYVEDRVRGKALRRKFGEEDFEELEWGEEQCHGSSGR